MDKFESPDLLGSIYNEEFYNDEAIIHTSALKYLELLCAWHLPNSVVDVGCGRGVWLRAWREKGITKLIGLDGPWNSQEQMVDQSIAFHAIDLNKPIRCCEGEKFDLAMTLEVAEHLEPASASTFIESLIKLSDVVLFGAAYTKQGGLNHLNERPHTYWANIFASFGYVPFDLFRPWVWGDPEIPFWYQQNTFLYVRTQAPLFHKLISGGKQPIVNIAFMDCIHPDLYEEKALKKDGAKKRIKELEQENARLHKACMASSTEDNKLRDLHAKES
jgi:hypothetical protein